MLNIIGPQQKPVRPHVPTAATCRTLQQTPSALAATGRAKLAPAAVAAQTASAATLAEPFLITILLGGLAQHRAQLELIYPTQ